MRPHVITSAAILALAALAGPALAADPAQAPIASFDDKLVAVMRDAKSLGFQGRYAQLKPVIEQTLDLPTMTKIAAGPHWAGMTEAQRQSLIEAFTRLTVATYANRLDGWSGEKFAMDPSVTQRGQDKIVQTRIVSKHSDPVTLAYRMRQTPAGAWKVIDIYYNGQISELVTRQSDFAATLANGGPKALADHLNAQAEKLAH